MTAGEERSAGAPPASDGLQGRPGGMGRGIAHYGSPGEEYRSLREGWALVDRSTALDCLELVGEDSRRFLNGMLTCDVRQVEPGGGVYGFLLSVQGRILADAAVLAGEDDFRLLLPAGRGDEVATLLGRYVIADRVEIGRSVDRVPITLIGQGLPESLAQSFPDLVLPAEPWAHETGQILGIEVGVVREGRLGLPAVSLWVAPERAAELFTSLLEAGRSAQLAACGEEALERVRVEAGLLRFGDDFGPDAFPQETGIDEAVSYTKGCYIGQEVVARIHYRGQVNRVPRGLLIEGRRPAGTLVLFEGREAGKVSSAVWSRSLDRTLGLSILHRRAAEPGTRVELGDGSGAEVVELPFDLAGE